MKTLKISFDNYMPCDKIETEPFYHILKQYYNLKIYDKVNEDLDLIICSPIENYKSVYNIADYFGIVKTLCINFENTYPDFNAYDYTTSYYEMLPERNLRLPMYWYYDYKIRHGLIYGDIEPFKNEPNFSNEVFYQKENRLGFVSSNAFRDGLDILYDLIDNFDCKLGGSFLGVENVGPNYVDKINFLSSCKFTLVFENSNNDGYVSEKIYDAYLANTIPIYFGSKEVCKDFNPESYIHVLDYPNIEDLFQHIRYLMNNEEAYMKVLNAKRVLNNIDYDKLVTDFMINIIENGKIYNHLFGNIMWRWYGKILEEKISQEVYLRYRRF